jgi:hypothetical protein
MSAPSGKPGCTFCTLGVGGSCKTLDSGPGRFGYLIDPSLVTIRRRRGTTVALCSRMKNGLLSQIRIVRVSDILPFEWEIEPERFPSDDLSEISFVRHPFPVIEIGDGRYVLLEDSARYYELLHADFCDLPVQICPRKSVRIRPLRLDLVDFGYNDLVRLTTRYPDQIVFADATLSVPDGYICAVFQFPYRDSVEVYLRHSTRIGCPWPLEHVFRSILQIGRYFPALERRYQPDSVFRAMAQSGSLVMPGFELGDIETAATSDRLFPPNTLQVSPDSRVFNIDFPASVLRADLPPDEKELFLRDLITIREQACRTTFFEGRVYILNR